jgi:hypothetical protein
MAGEHQQARGDEFLASPGGTGEPGARDGSGALGADVVAALGHLAEVIDQGLQFGPFGSEQGSAVEGGGEGLVFRGRVSQYRTNVRRLLSMGTPTSEPPCETRDSRRGGNAAAERLWMPGLEQNRPMCGIVEEIDDSM